MKKTSKMALIIGAIIIAAGFVFCLIGAGVSSATGNQLFAKSTDEGRAYTYYFDDSDVGKIKLDVSDADINITGGADEAYIEIINFNENFYTFQCSKALISFKESPDVSSVLKFWESGFTFKGLRYVLRPYSTGDGKIINIYLTDAEYVKCFEIIAENCNLYASDLSGETDYNVTMGTGTVRMDNISTGSTVSVISEDSEGISAVLADCTVKKLGITAQKCDLDAEKLTLNTGEIAITSGTAEMSVIPSAEKFAVDVSTSGRLTVGEHNYIDKFSYPAEDDKNTDDTGKDSDTTEAEESASLTVTGRDLAVTLDFDGAAEAAAAAE